MEEFVLSPEAQREQAALQASIERMRAERLQLDAQNRVLQALIEREERLEAHLQEVLAASRTERQVIEAEDDGSLQVKTRPPFTMEDFTITHEVLVETPIEKAGGKR